jgi:hypothetical protein
MVCNELLRQQQVDTSLFAPLRSLLSSEETDGTLDLLSADSTLSGYVQESVPVPGVDPLGIAGSISDLLGDLAEDVGPFVEGAEEAGQVLSLAGDAMAVGSEFSRQDTVTVETDHTVGQISVQAGDLATWLANRYVDATSATDEIEAAVFSDPNKLTAAFNRTSGTGGWNLGTVGNLDFARTNAITFQAQLSALNYMYPRLVGAAATTSCAQHGNNFALTAPPMSYVGWVDVGQGNAGSNTGLIPFVVQIGSLTFSSSAGQSLTSQLFSDGAVGYNNGRGAPSAASLVPTDFFMTGIANNNTACTYNSGLCCLNSKDAPSGNRSGGAADRRRRGIHRPH